MRLHLAVALGAVMGASARWGLGEAIPHDAGTFPWSTLIANLVGCALGGLAIRWIIRGSTRWVGAVTGFLGGLTTFSSFAVETRDLVDGGHGGRALVYVAVSVVGGIAAVELGRAGHPGRTPT